MSTKEKTALLKAGRFLLFARPACTAWWTPADWIAYIDRRGRWLDRPLPQDST